MPSIGRRILIEPVDESTKPRGMPRSDRSAREHVLVRSPVDLIELPYTFTQLPPLTPQDFIREARARGVHVTDAQLEALHQARLLTPIFRVRRDGRLIRRLAASTRRSMYASQVAHQDPTNRRDLVHAFATETLTDPGRERFMSRAARERKIGRLEYFSSEYLYSAHQLLMLPTVRTVLPHLKVKRAAAHRSLELDVNRQWLGFAQARADDMRDIAVAVTALEPIYYPRIMGNLTLPDMRDFDAFYRWRSRLPLLAMRTWLGVDAEWIQRAGASLLDSANAFDPLGDWLEVVRAADPTHWKRLKHTARSAMDHRVAAEILLRYYDALVRGRRAKALPSWEGRWRPPFDSRLTPRGNLDQVLTEYGLSPHPSLVLVVEGETEFRFFPRVMRMFGVRTERDFIAIEDMGGVERDLETLVSFAIAPRTEVSDHGRYLEPLRPLTRLLVVTDSEGRLATEADRQRKRRAWVHRLMRTLPREHRTGVVKESIDSLVRIETWDRAGNSFEFAHFTDRELAQAIMRVGAKGQPTLAGLTSWVAGVRASRGNLKTLLDGRPKVALAEELWPVLERKIRRAERRGTEARIPIVRVLDQALRVIHELPRGKIVIPLHPRQQAA